MTPADWTNRAAWGRFLAEHTERRLAAQKPAEKTAEPIPADSSDRPRSVATSRRPSQRRLARH